MRNSIDITRPYQFGYMLLHHIYAVLISIVFQAVACWYFLDKPVMSKIVAAVFTIVYGGIIYSYSRKLSVWDSKPYTPLKSELKWGVLWGVMISATVMAFFAVYKLNWALFSKNGSMTSLAGVVINLLFYIWTAPYFGFMGASGGYVPAYTLIIMALVPIAASTLGYIAGRKNFDVIEKLDSMTFEKDDEDDENDEA